MRNVKSKQNTTYKIRNRVLLSISHFLFLVYFSFLICHFSFSKSHSFENCVIYSDGNALYAVNRVDSQPLWSETGEFYRETFDFDDWTFAPESQKKKRNRPTQMFAEHLVREGRLYVILNRSAFSPKRGNVLVAFDLKQEGKLLWRIALDEEQYSRKLRFDFIETLIDGELTVLLSDRSVMRINVTDFGGFQRILGPQASCLHLGLQASSLHEAGRMPAVPGTLHFLLIPLTKGFPKATAFCGVRRSGRYSA